jgi:uncharacterized protein YjeT (DUF2065 family)
LTIRVPAVEDVMITKLMAISEHHLRFEGLPAIARAFSVIVEGLGVVAAPADAPHSGAAREPRVRVVTDGGSAAAGAG